jgi:hypothetical protein
MVKKFFICDFFIESSINMVHRPVKCFVLLVTVLSKFVPFLLYQRYLQIAAMQTCFILLSRFMVRSGTR